MVVESSYLRKIATRLFLARSDADLRSRKTSASSSRRTARQNFASSNQVRRFLSTDVGSVPMSAQVREIRGLLISSATHSMFHPVTW